MDIAVFGAGNGAHALAGDLALHGHNVRLWENPSFSDNIKHLERSGGKLTLTGAASGEAKLSLVTTEAAAALDGAEAVFVLMPSYGQESAFDYMAPHLKDGQAVLVMPGNFGAISLYLRMKARGLENQILIGESDTIPYAARLDNNTSCNIFGVKGSVWASAVPASATDRLLQKIEGILPVKLLPLPSALAVALANTNMIIHCPTMIMNAGRIETGERFRFYNDGMSASVCSVMEKMDEERLAVGKAWGYNLVPEFEDALANYDLDSTQYRNLHEIFSLHPVYSKMGADSPQSVTHRYITEDVPYLLVPLSEMGKMVKVPTPTIDAIIHLASIINKTNYPAYGRGLKAMGFKNIAFENIKDIVHG